jgi:heat shock protein HslJ
LKQGTFAFSIRHLKKTQEKVMKKYLVPLILIALLLSACTSQEKSLAGSWKLTSYGPEGSSIPAAENTEAGLTFNEDGTVTGNSGCNGLGGEYTVEGDQIEFGPFVSTLMACEDPIMAQESAMLQVLTGTATFDIEGDTLRLKNNDMVFVFTAAEGQ